MNHSSVLRFGALVTLGTAALFGSACDPAPKSDPELAADPAPSAESDPRVPGIDTVDESLQQRLDKALASQGAGYIPRTHHLNEDGSPRFTNRLIEMRYAYRLPDRLQYAVKANYYLSIQKDPEKAIAWTESHLVGKARMTAVVKAMGMLDNEKATEVLHTMTPGPGKNLAAAKVFESLIDSSRGTDPERVEDWITHFPDSAARSYSLDQEAGNLAREQPELAVSLAESEDPSIARRGVIRNAAWHLAKEDPVSAAAWARSLPERNRKIAEDALAR